MELGSNHFNSLVWIIHRRTPSVSLLLLLSLVLGCCWRQFIVAFRGGWNLLVREFYEADFLANDASWLRCRLCGCYSWFRCCCQFCCRCFLFWCFLKPNVNAEWTSPQSAQTRVAVLLVVLLLIRHCFASCCLAQTTHVWVRWQYVLLSPCLRYLKHCKGGTFCNSFFTLSTIPTCLIILNRLSLLLLASLCHILIYCWLCDAKN